MERRAFLKVAFGVVAGAAVAGTAAQAAPLLSPQLAPGQPETPNELKPQPAVADQNDLDAARIEEVRWGRRRRGWRRRRFWGYRRRRFWGRRRWRRRRFWL